MVEVCHHSRTRGGRQEKDSDVVMETHQGPQVSVVRLLGTEDVEKLRTTSILYDYVCVCVCVCVAAYLSDCL